MIEHPTSAGVLVSHQRGRANDINLNEPDNPDPYAGPGCTPILHSAVSHVQFGSVNTSGAITDVALPVDLYADAGTIYMTSAAVGAPVDVTSLGYDVLDRDGECMTFGGTNMPHTSATSAAAMDQGGYWVSAGAGPYALSRGDYVMPVTPGRAPSQGWINFHTAPSNDLACASCHPEGQDDGHVWSFTGIGPRRTQSVSIGVRGTEPLHWDGDLVDMHALVTEVFVNRMGGFEMGHAGEESLMEFLDGLVPVRGVTYASAEDIELGRELFENPAVGCTDCHSGDKFTNNETRLVGTGDDLQVPSLVGIGSRPPYMHDGCAPTLLDRFLDDTCGGGDDHGFTAILSDVQIGLVVEYLNTL
jgi:hypothetical protein